MSTRNPSRSHEALKKAMGEVGCAVPSTAALLLFFAAVNELTALLGAERTAEITYAVADDLAVGKIP